MPEIFGKKVSYDRLRPIIMRHQNTGRIPKGIKPDDIMDRVTCSLLPCVVKIDLAAKKQVNAAEIIEQGNRILAESKLLREQMSERFRQRIIDVAGEPRCFTLSGPSGCGKQAINDALENKGLPRVRLWNIRNDRGTEELYGVAYHFVRLSASEEREYQALIQKEQDPLERKALNKKLYQKRAELLMAYNSKYNFISSEGIHEHKGLISQAVPDILFTLGRQKIDSFIEVDIDHAKKIILRSDEEKAKGNNINIFPIFLLPVDYNTLLMQLMLRTIGEPDNETGVCWYKEIFGDGTEVIDDAKTKKIGEYVGNRGHNGIKNITESLALNPLYVVNDDLNLTTKEIITFCDFKFPVDASQAQPNRRVSGFVTIKTYEDQIKQQTRILGLGLPFMQLDLKQEPQSKQSYLNNILRIKKAHGGKITAADYAEANLLSVNLIWPNESEFHDLEKKKDLEKPDVGIFPGSFSPFHYGYMSAVLAAMKDWNLNGVIVMPGAETPRRFEIAFQHRLNMCMIVAEKYRFMKVSPLRTQFSALLAKSNLGGADVEEEQRLRDIGAFSFLISMNPHVQFHYFAGADKMNLYGPSKKNEEELLKLLFESRVPLMWQKRMNHELQLFENEWKHYFEVLQPNKIDIPWLLSQEKGFNERSLLKGCTTPTFSIDTEEKRRKISERYPLFDYMSPCVIDYMYRKRIYEGYVLSLEYRNLVGEVMTALEKKISIGHLENELRSKLSDINAQKVMFADEGILADKSPLSFEILIQDAKNILARKPNEEGL